MKIKNIFMSLLAVLFVAAGCTVKNCLPLEEIRVSEDFIILPVDGSRDAVVGLTAIDTWKITSAGEKELPDWVTITPSEGEAGSHSVKFHADASEIAHESKLEVHCAGQIQQLIVKQGVQSKDFTPLKKISEEGIVGATYYVKAKIAKITKMKYGNLILEDESGTLNVYGTLNKEGQEGHFADLGIAEGDEIEAHGPFSPYNGTPQLKNITVDKIIKSLVAPEEENDKFDLEKNAQTIDVKLKVSGDGVEVHPYILEIQKVIEGDKEVEKKIEKPCDWITLGGLNVTDGKGTLTLNIAANEDVTPRTAYVKVISRKEDASSTISIQIDQKGNVPPVKKIAEAVAKLGDYVAIDGYAVAAHDKGYILSDGTDVIYVYTDSKPEVKLGKNITVCGFVGEYKKHFQIKEPIVLDREGTSEVKHPEAVTITQEMFDGILAGENRLPDYVTITGVPTGSKGVIMAAEHLKITPYKPSESFKYPADFEGKEIIVEGYAIQAYPGSTDYPDANLNIVLTKVSEKGELKPLFEESFNAGFGAFTIENVLLPEGEDNVWSHGVYEKVGYIKASGHYGGKDGSDKATEALMISPKIKISRPDVKLSFDHCGNYFKGADDAAKQAQFKADVSLVVREDGKEWTKLEIPGWGSGKKYEYVTSGEISLAAYENKEIQFAFRYTSTEKCAGTWQIQNVLVK